MTGKIATRQYRFRQGYYAYRIVLIFILPFLGCAHAKNEIIAQDRAFGHVDRFPVHFKIEDRDLDWLRTRAKGHFLRIDSNRTKKTQRIIPELNFARLKEALRHYRDIAKKGGWPEIAAGPFMKKHSRSWRVVTLRSRLISSGDLVAVDERDSEVFDDALEHAVLNFQKRHGRKVDGIVGPDTLAALNVPAEARIRQIELNIERLRRSSKSFGQRYILINSANFELRLVENGQTVMKMRAVVGRPDRPTPVYSGEMTHLELNPYWYIPLKIAREDILPRIHKDPNYLTETNIRVFEIKGKEKREIDPGEIDWSIVTEKNFFYKLRQEPGPFNALGRLKFIFPNRTKVHIHDTPARELFQKSQRSFSSGCIRIEAPVDLAEYLLRSDNYWKRSKILAVINRGKRKKVQLPEPFPVHLVYLTAWVDGNGNIQFRDDIYARDKILAETPDEKRLASNP